VCKGKHNFLNTQEKMLIFIKKISCCPYITQVATRDYIVSPFISDG